MSRILLMIAIVVLAVACTRNPEGAERRRSTPRPASEPAAEVAADRAPADPLPPGHPPLDGFEDPNQAAAGEAPAGATADGARAAVAGVRWEAPPPLRFRQPSSSMRAAEYVIDGGDEQSVLTVFFFPGGGGGIQANIDRWVGQMQTTEARPPEITTLEVNDLRVTKIDVHGGYGGMQMPGQAAAPPSESGFRMLGAIVEGPEGPVFFKLVGPEPIVNLAADAFETLIASFHVAP